MQRQQSRGCAHISVSPEVLQELDLAQGTLGQDLLAEDIGDLLDGDTFVGLVVHGGAGGGRISKRQAGIAKRGVKGLILTRQSRKLPGPVPW